MKWVGFPILATCLTLVACNKNPEGEPGTRFSGNSAAIASSTLDNAANARAAPQLGRCYMGECSWSVEQARTTIRKESSGRLIAVTLLGGTSYHEEAADYPGRFRPNLKIEWNSAPHKVYIFCAKSLPATMMVTENGLEVDVLDFVNGPPGMMEGSAALYTSVCHGRHVRWTEKGFARKFGYRALPSDKQEISLDEPEDIFSLVKSLSSDTDDAPTQKEASKTGAAIPRRFQGEWNEKVEDCGTGNNDSRLRVGEHTIRFYESSAAVRSVDEKSDGSVAVQAQFTGEGETWEDGLTWHIDSSGNLVSGDYARKRCP